MRGAACATGMLSEDMAEVRTTITKPKPRIRGILGIFLIGCVGAALLHGAWGWRAERALHDRIETLRAHGQRVLPEDFSSKRDVNMYENAARDLRAAIAIADDDSEEADSVSWVPSTRPADPRAWPYLARATVWFEPAVRRIEAAQRKPICDWEHRVPSPAIDLLLPELNGMRGLENVLSTTALVEHRDGRDDLVVRRFAQMLYLADTCAQTPAMVAHSVALGLNESATTRIELLAPDLRIGTTTGDAPVADVHKLIATLLDETTIQSGFDTALQAERMSLTDTIAYLGRDEKQGFALRYFARPWVEQQALAALERATVVIDAVDDAADWPTARARLAALPPMPKRAGLAHDLDSLTTIRRASETHFLTLADRRLAATALAIRLYQRDHAGARPSTLDELVPAYLPKIPLDAMAAGGQVIKYLPRADRPVLYSAGQNGVDDSGSEAPMPNEYGWFNEWRRLDRVFYLTARVRDDIYIPRPTDSDGAMMGGFVYADGAPPWDVEARAAAATRPLQPPASSASPTHR